MKLTEKDRRRLRIFRDQAEQFVGLEQQRKAFKGISKDKKIRAELRIGARFSIDQAEEKLEKLVDKIKHEER